MFLNICLHVTYFKNDTSARSHCFSLEDMINAGPTVSVKCTRTTTWDLLLLLCVLINQEFNVLHYET
jgi:hypothetical protein